MYFQKFCKIYSCKISKGNVTKLPGTKSKLKKKKPWNIKKILLLGYEFQVFKMNVKFWKYWFPLTSMLTSVKIRSFKFPLHKKKLMQEKSKEIEFRVTYVYCGNLFAFIWWNLYDGYVHSFATIIFTKFLEIHWFKWQRHFVTNTFCYLLYAYNANYWNICC